MPSYEFLSHLPMDASLDASLQLEELRQGKTDVTGEIEKLAVILDMHVEWGEDSFFFSDVFRRLFPAMTTIDEVEHAFRETVRELRSIATFKVGKHAEMKRFCLALNDALISEAYADIYKQRRGLAA